jgi:hypothetical protein
MGWGEQDKVDTSLIIAESRVPQPTARARGLHHQEEKFGACKGYVQRIVMVVWKPLKRNGWRSILILT